MDESAHSTFLSSDLSIMKLAKKINPVENYWELALVLLEDEPRVATIIGRQTTNFRDIVFKIFIKWRNANGNQPDKLENLFVKLGLEAARKYLSEELKKDTNFLTAKDSNLYTLASKISCVAKHRDIALGLDFSDVDLENIIGLTHVQYEDALYKAFIAWRDAHSPNMTTFHELQTILESHGQKEASEYMETLEKEGLNPGLLSTAVDEATRNTDEHTINEDRADGYSSSEPACEYTLRRFCTV
ncbi:uncharacterized protein [Diadema antillarum]|uniref:uncharacterized protein isoform X2 n=1 Tax=Diadema antillarum TaxID=105358 RepID=UPI003A8BD3C9